MKTLKLFLASSNELKADRERVEIFVGRKNKQWLPAGKYIDLVLWEDFLDVMSPTSLQDEYNKAIRECDVFVMLFFTKVGKYTSAEFEAAFGQFTETKKPAILTYFRDAEVTTGNLNKEDLMSLFAFKERLDALGHFVSRYRNSDDLTNQLNRQLDKLSEGALFGANTKDAEAARPDLRIVEVYTSETDTGLSTIDITMRNRGAEPLVLKAVDLDVRSVRLDNCSSEFISKLVPSAEYDLILTPSDERQTKRVRISQQLGPHSTDRFVIVVDTTENNVLYQVGIAIVYNEDNSVVHAGQALLLFEDLLSVTIPDPAEKVSRMTFEDPQRRDCIRRNVEKAKSVLSPGIVLSERLAAFRQRVERASALCSEHQETAPKPGHAADDQ